MLKLIRGGLLCLQHREPVEGSPTGRPQLSRFWPVAAGRAPASLWLWPSSVGKFQGLGVSHLWACGQATDQNSCPHLLLTPTKPPLLVMPLGFCPGTEPPSSGFPVSHGCVCICLPWALQGPPLGGTTSGFSHLPQAWCVLHLISLSPVACPSAPGVLGAHRGGIQAEPKQSTTYNANARARWSLLGGHSAALTGAGQPAACWPRTRSPAPGSL